MPPMKKSANVSRLKSLSRSKDSNSDRIYRAMESGEKPDEPRVRRAERNKYGEAKASIDRGIREPSFDPWLGDENSRDSVVGNLVKSVGSSMRKTAQPMSSRQAIQILREYMKNLAKNMDASGDVEEIDLVRSLIDKLTGERSINRKIRRGGKVNVSPKDPTRRRAIRDRQRDHDTVDRFLRGYESNPDVEDYTDEYGDD